MANGCTVPIWFNIYDIFETYTLYGYRASTVRNVMPTKLAQSPHYSQSSTILYGSITFTIWQETPVWLIKLRLPI